MTLLGDARIVLMKDLQIERRSQVTLRQVIPFVITMVVLLGYGLDRVLVDDPLVSGDTVPVPFVAPGMFWLAVLFSAVLVIQRSIGAELDDGAWEQLRLWGLDPAGVFLGKAAAVGVQLFVVELVLAGAITLAFGVSVPARAGAWALLVCVLVLATIALSAVASAYAALSAGIRVRETLVPVLLLPVTVPLLIAAVQAWQGALTDEITTGWAWVRVVAVFAVVYTAVGTLAYGALMED